jgi:hypothetical protein
MVGFGFQPCRYEPFPRALRVLRDVERGNVVFVRDPDAVAETLRAATPFVVNGRRI